jgi:hypothetical protein
MPAILDEAFTSPFDKVMGGPNNNTQDTGSSDIRAQPQHQQQQQHQQHQQQHPQPYQQNYRIADVEHEANGLKSMYNTLDSYGYQRPQQNQPLKHMHEPDTGIMVSPDHNCDVLIAKMMACRVCRKKLIALMREDLKRDAEAANEPEQSGGSIFSDLGSNSFIVNFIIGIALIFLMDNIIKLKLR